MPNTYSQIYIQLVFAVKGRQNLIKEKNREQIEKYISGITSNLEQKLLAIYCNPDHVHILISIKPTISISELAQKIKNNSSKFINDEKLIQGKFEWQSGYGAFSYSKSQIDTVVKYILNQKEHHKIKTFREEYIEFLQKFEIEYDDKYLFEFIDLSEGDFE